MSTRRIRDYLIGTDVSHTIAKHLPAYSAQEVAQATHVPCRNMAKTVIVWLDDKLAMAVIPATRDLDWRLRDQTATDNVRLATEAEFAKTFAGCQLGTVPPFGVLFGVRTFVDLQLALQDEIAFNAGTHTEVIIMKFADFRRLVRPLMVDISTTDIGKAMRITPARRGCGLRPTKRIQDAIAPAQVESLCSIAAHQPAD